MRLRKHALAALGVTLLATVAVQAKDKKPEEKGEAAKPAVKKPTISEYDTQINEANKSFAAGMAGGATDDAIAKYRKGITLDPNRPEGHLLLAGALYHKGDLAGAEEAANSAVSRSKSDLKNFANWHGKALFVVATIKEALKKPEEAKTAWKDYAEFAKDNPDKPFPEGSGDAPPVLLKVYPASATDRLAKLDAYAKSVLDYAKVKELIMKRQKELGIDPTPKAPAP